MRTERKSDMNTTLLVVALAAAIVLLVYLVKGQTAQIKALQNISRHLFAALTDPIMLDGLKAALQDLSTAMLVSDLGSIKTELEQHNFLGRTRLEAVLLRKYVGIIESVLKDRFGERILSLDHSGDLLWVVDVAHSVGSDPCINVGARSMTDTDREHVFSIDLHLYGESNELVTLCVSEELEATIRLPEGLEQNRLLGVHDEYAMRRYVLLMVEHYYSATISKIE